MWSATGLKTDRVFALAVHPANPAIVYAGADGGVYRTTDGGTTWTKVLSNLVCRALAIDPRVPETVYAGTAVGSFAEDDVFKTLDGGTTWINTRLTSAGVYALAVHPTSPNTIYAGTWQGVFKWQENRISLWFPYYRGGSEAMTGIAVSNYSADLEFTAYGSEASRWFFGGTKNIPLPFIDNPHTRSIHPRSQLAENGHELFSTQAANPQAGWVHLTSSNPDIGSFFLVVGTGAAAGHMDGAVAWTEAADKLYFTRVYEGPYVFRGESATTTSTTLSIVNTGDSIANARVRLWLWEEGAVRKSVEYWIPAKGCLQGTLSELFGETVQSAGGYVTADTDLGASKTPTFVPA